MATNEDVLKKIRKLLALSQSPNEHEAAAAAARATALLRAHRLTLDDVSDAEFVQVDLTLSEMWQSWLLGTLCDTNDVRLIASADMRWPRLHRVVGESTTVASVREFYEVLANILRVWSEESWARHVEEYTDPLYGVYPSLLEEGAEPEWKMSFCLGAVSRLRDRLDTVEEVEETPGALIRLKQQRDAVDQYVLARYRLRPEVVNPPAAVNSRAAQYGMLAGERLPVTPQKPLPGK